MKRCQKNAVTADDRRGHTPFVVGNREKEFARIGPHAAAGPIDDVFGVVGANDHWPGAVPAPSAGGSPKLRSRSLVERDTDAVEIADENIAMEQRGTAYAVLPDVGAEFRRRFGPKHLSSVSAQAAQVPL